MLDNLFLTVILCHYYSPTSPGRFKHPGVRFGWQEHGGSQGYQVAPLLGRTGGRDTKRFSVFSLAIVFNMCQNRLVVKLHLPDQSQQGKQYICLSRDLSHRNPCIYIFIQYSPKYFLFTYPKQVCSNVFQITVAL